MGVDESQITGTQTNAYSQYMQLTRATHETGVYLHDFPRDTPGDKVQTGDGRNVQLRLERMIRHRDLDDWIAVDCDKKGAPMPVFVQPG